MIRCLEMGRGVVSIAKGRGTKSKYSQDSEDWVYNLRMWSSGMGDLHSIARAACASFADSER